MPQGKAAGVRCVQLDAGNRCLIFGKPERPAVCSGLKPSVEMCGGSQAYAMRYLTQLETLTAQTTEPWRSSSSGDSITIRP